MKKSVLFSLTIFFLTLLSSCAIYEEPCEGVGHINISELDS
ncbi:MAG: hypothetical protein VX762_02660 [Bacteroidota bacterium]|nr:hypothetical protein [Bacteroidota bacterium]